MNNTIITLALALVFTLSACGTEEAATTTQFADRMWVSTEMTPDEVSWSLWVGAGVSVVDASTPEGCANVVELWIAPTSPTREASDLSALAQRMESVAGITEALVGLHGPCQ